MVLIAVFWPWLALAAAALVGLALLRRWRGPGAHIRLQVFLAMLAANSLCVIPLYFITFLILVGAIWAENPVVVTSLIVLWWLSGLPSALAALLVRQTREPNHLSVWATLLSASTAVAVISIVMNWSSYGGPG